MKMGRTGEEERRQWWWPAVESKSFRLASTFHLIGVPLAPNLILCRKS